MRFSFPTLTLGFKANPRETYPNSRPQLMKGVTMTGFLSLPFELREMIYLNLLPEDRFFSISPSLSAPQEREIYNLSKTNKQVQREIDQITRSKCGLRIIVTPNYNRISHDLSKFLKSEPGSRKAIEKSIEIFIDYDNDKLDPRHYKNNIKLVKDLDILTNLCDELRTVLRVLERYPSLPPTTIRFRDEPIPCSGPTAWGDPFWTGECDQCEDCEGGIGRYCSIMAETHDLGKNIAKLGISRPYFIEILLTFTERRRLRNKFKSLYIVPLKGVSDPQDGRVELASRWQKEWDANEAEREWYDNVSDDGSFDIPFPQRFRDEIEWRPDPQLSHADGREDMEMMIREVQEFLRYGGQVDNILRLQRRRST